MTDHTIKPDWDEASAAAASAATYLSMTQPDNAIGLTAGGTSNNYNISTYGNVHFTVASAGTHTITGFSGGEEGRVLVLTCEGGTVNLAHANTASTAGNRLSNLTGGNVTLTPFQRALYIYSADLGVWYELPLLSNTLDIDYLTVSGTVTGLTAASVAAGAFPASDYTGMSSLRLGGYLALDVLSTSSSGDDFDLQGCGVLAVGASATYTGFAGGVDGRVLYIRATGGTTTTLSHNSGSSSAGNKISCPGGTDYSITQLTGATLVYIGYLGLWVVMDK